MWKLMCCLVLFVGCSSKATAPQVQPEPTRGEASLSAVKAPIPAQQIPEPRMGWKVAVAQPQLGRLRAIWGMGPTDVWAAGDVALIHFDGTEWKLVVAAPGVELSEQEKELFARRGASADAAETMKRVFTGNRFGFAAIWGDAADDFWIGGSGKTMLHVTSAGSKVTPVPLSDEEADPLLGGFQGLWGTSSRNVMAVNMFGATLRWNGKRWAKLPSIGKEVAVFSAWGTSEDAWAVGASGAYHWNGRRWTKAAGPHGLWAVWGSSPADVWAVGGEDVDDNGNPLENPKSTLLRWNGARWAEVTVDTSDMLRSIWGSGPNDVWVSARGRAGGSFLHWDGSAWTTERTEGAAQIEAIWGSGPRDVWAVGDKGLVLHYAQQ